MTNIVFATYQVQIGCVTSVRRCSRDATRVRTSGILDFVVVNARLIVKATEDDVNRHFKRLIIFQTWYYTNYLRSYSDSYSYTFRKQEVVRLCYISSEHQCHRLNCDYSLGGVMGSVLMCIFSVD